MKKKFDNDLKYLCNINTLLNYMEKEIEFAINNKLDLATDFYILYKGVDYHLDIWINYNEDKVEPLISLNNQQYNSMVEFKENANLGEILIKNIKDNLEIALIYHDSVYLEENEIKDDKIIKKKEFKYNKELVKLYLLFAIFFTLFAFVSHWLFWKHPLGFIIYIFTDSMASWPVFGYLYYKKRKIIYREGLFTVYGIFNKKIYKIEDIESVIEQPPKGITVKMKDGNKFKFDTFMTNQRYARRILKQNGIEIKHIPFKNYFEFYKK